MRDRTADRTRDRAEPRGRPDAAVLKSGRNRVEDRAMVEWAPPPGGGPYHFQYGTALSAARPRPFLAFSVTGGPV